MRPSHGIVSVAGVMPFSPTFDTVGILARSSDVLERAMARAAGWRTTAARTSRLRSISLARRLRLADLDVAKALQAPVDRLRDSSVGGARNVTRQPCLDDDEAVDLSTWLDTFRLLRSAEVDSCLGPWVARRTPNSARPRPPASKSFEQLIARKSATAIRRREHHCRQLSVPLGPRDLLCIPTAPTSPPIKGTASHDRHGDFYSRTLSLTSIAGIGRLPQVSMPLADVSGVPVGLSLVGAHGEDMWLLRNRDDDSHAAITHLLAANSHYHLRTAQHVLRIGNPHAGTGRHARVRRRRSAAVDRTTCRTFRRLACIPATGQCSASRPQNEANTRNRIRRTGARCKAGCGPPPCGPRGLSESVRRNKTNPAARYRRPATDHRRETAHGSIPARPVRSGSSSASVTRLVASKSSNGQGSSKIDRANVLQHPADRNRVLRIVRAVRIGVDRHLVAERLARQRNQRLRAAGQCVLVAAHPAAHAILHRLSTCFVEKLLR